MQDAPLSSPVAATVAYVNCNDATLHMAQAILSPDEASKLTAAMAWLEELGLLLRPTALAPKVARPLDFDGVVAGLRAGFGHLVVEAALGCTPSTPPGERERPVSLATVYPLYPEGGDSDDRDVLLGSARLWGCELLLELLRAEDPDSPAPVTTVRPRYQRWHAAAGGGGKRATARPTGEAGAYLVAAISAPV